MQQQEKQQLEKQQHGQLREQQMLQLQQQHEQLRELQQSLLCLWQLLGWLLLVERSQLLLE